MIHWVFFMKIRKEEELERGTIVSPETDLATHGRQRKMQVNNARHTVNEWKKK